jgi:PIN domain nuclease of toxin-antitoxin system
LPFLQFVPVDNRIAVRATRLTDFPHRDPADRDHRLTAQPLGAKLATRDERLRCYGEIEKLR